MRATVPIFIDTVAATLFAVHRAILLALMVFGGSIPARATVLYEMWPLATTIANGHIGDFVGTGVVNFTLDHDALTDRFWVLLDNSSILPTTIFTISDNAGVKFSGTFDMNNNVLGYGVASPGDNVLGFPLSIGLAHGPVTVTGSGFTPCCGPRWSTFNGVPGLEFNGTILDASVPTPATLPLFITGLGLMGWFAWRKKRKVGLLTLAVAVTVACATSSARADPILFTDDFNRYGGITTNTVGNGWVENESAPTDARIILGVELELNGPFGVSVTQHIGSTLGYVGTYTAFDWRGLFAEPGDLLVFFGAMMARRSPHSLVMT